jgi:leucyl aminopeptidase
VRAARRYGHLTLPVTSVLSALRAATSAHASKWTADMVAAALVEGALLGGYRFLPYRSDPPSGVAKLAIVGSEVSAAKVRRAVRLAGAVLLARDLGNEPGGVLTPAEFAQRAAGVAAQAGLRAQVWDRDRIRREGLGGLLGVNRGSAQPPRLVRLDYEPDLDAPRGSVALVGKGVTFDSGGLTVKPIQMMFDMKLDMAGAAAVLAAMSVLGALACPVRVTGWLPLTDNMSGGDALRVGDVIKVRNGRTVEVINPDAEGRLLLADALSLAAEQKPDAIVDLATLTDTVAMAAGRRYAGLSANHSGWQAQVSAAAARAGELVWPMPVNEADRRRLDSKVADLINCPHYKYGQSTLAALFLSEFVPASIAWAHLDIAGPAVSEEDDGIWSAGATGFGVRTLVELLCGYQPPASVC